MSLQSQAPNAQTSQYLLKLMTNSILSTIQICGFDIKSNEKEHKIQFNWSLFTRPNQKAFDVIVHFLLCQIDPEKAEKAFNQIWPVILKEQQKEFKDVVLNWLLEISQKSNSKNDKQNQPNQIIQQYQYVLHLIRFPIITKSLLMTPGGIKICELLFALCQYALIVNLARLIESNKLNIRIPPKVSPFTGSENTKQPFSQVQSTNTNNPGGISRIVNQKQMANYEILINSLKRRVDLDLNEFHQFIFKLLEIRTKWQQNSLAKTNNIRALVDKKIYLTQSLARKKALLARQLNVQETEINDENASLESLYTQFKEIKLSQFEKKWLEFKKINDESLENDFNKENIDCLISNTNLNCTENGSTTTTRKLQLDGQDFLNSLLNKSECDETNINDFENKILKFIYENMDRNSTFRNTEIGPLFSEDGKQLNLINLVRLYNLVLILNGELISKVDRERLGLFANLLNSFTQSEESELIPIDDDSSQKSLLSNIFKGNKIINEESLRLKKKLDAFLPKLNENYCQLFEKDVVKAKIPASPFKDEVSNQVKEFLKEYFNLGKASLNPKLLKTLREKRQLELSSKQESKLDPIDESFKLSNESDENNLDDYEQSTKKNTAKKSINFSLDFVEKNNSFELLDLQDSNMDLI